MRFAAVHWKVVYNDVHLNVRKRCDVSGIFSADPVYRMWPDFSVLTRLDVLEQVFRGTKDILSFVQLYTDSPITFDRSRNLTYDFESDSSGATVSAKGLNQNYHLTQRK